MVFFFFFFLIKSTMISKIGIFSLRRALGTRCTILSNSERWDYMAKRWNLSNVCGSILIYSAFVKIVKKHRTTSFMESSILETMTCLVTKKNFSTFFIYSLVSSSASLHDQFKFSFVIVGKIFRYVLTAG